MIPSIPVLIHTDYVRIVRLYKCYQSANQDRNEMAVEKLQTGLYRAVLADSCRAYLNGYV